MESYYKRDKQLTAKTTEAKNDLTDLTDIRSQLFDLERTLDRFTSEVESSSTDLKEGDGDKWNNAISDYFTKSKQLKMK